MKKTQYTEVELKEIEAIQEQRSITRKSAVRIFEKSDRRIILTAAEVIPASAPEAVEATERIANVVGDEQVAAAVDQNETIVSDNAPAKKVRVKKTEPTPVVKLTAAEAGKARGAGIKLFALAGRPTKEQFILVYGENGPKMTWDQRAAAGVPAEKFQAALAAKTQSN